ncbi:hypothetical protein BDU57DRAFT_503571 [Ampelomyces quisqualis]|uniref:Uncharacterized protein n=1 Tax=Ampelomyces quisqualis TaxID=50730 RepID=A0A6A5QDM7_AMPQU|nr:hypothetical protein BDU57DRAFT_503571 [Ampelomyces quisqualis]
MSGVLCVWAKLPDDALEWYEHEFIPDKREKISKCSLLCELTTSGLEGEPIGYLDSPWPLMAVYDIDEIAEATKDHYEKERSHPSEELLTGRLAEARLDFRTYREVRTWKKEHWDEDVSHIASVTAMEWKVSAERQDEVLEFYNSYVAPKVASNPDVLRLRMFEVDNATVLQGNSYETKEKDSLHTYFTLVEFETDDWPWGAVVELAENAGWRKYFDAQKLVKWQLSHYLVKRSYTADGSVGRDLNDKSGDKIPDDA